MNPTRNPVTGDFIKTKTNDPKAYESNWDLIFAKPEKKEEQTNGND